MDFAAQFSAYVERAQHAVRDFAPRHGPPRLSDAIGYSLAAGGKRLRPVLALATADLFGAPRGAADAAAAAIEYIHTYSLIHDDLPCMDNDDLRRGRPTVHKQFDEATALLTGDALLTHAFLQIGLSYGHRPETAVQLLLHLGQAAGDRQLIGGQMDDLLAEKNPAVTAEELRRIHLRKTGAMLATSLCCGAIVAGASRPHVDSLQIAGEELGLAFQIVDDVLDATADTATLGKTAGKDAKADKTTYVKLFGIARSRELAAQHTASVLERLAALPGDTAFLTALIRSMAERTH